MNQAQQILDYLWSIAPTGTTNCQIGEALGIHSQQGVYMTTRDLMVRRHIRGEQKGKTWTFYALDDPEVELVAAAPPTRASLFKPGKLSPARFESLARSAMCRAFGVTGLPRGTVGNVPKEFDYVSVDRQIVGDAKYYTRVGGTGLPQLNSRSLRSMCGC